MKRVCVSAMRRIIHFDNNVMKKGCSKNVDYMHTRVYLRSYGSSKNLELIHELTWFLSVKTAQLIVFQGFRFLLYRTHTERVNVQLKSKINKSKGKQNW